MISEIIGSLMLLAGLFFFVVGTIGLLRMPDIYSRLHATTKCDTLGVFLILTGLMVGQGLTTVSLKILLVLAFLWITTPTAAHAIARAAYDTHKISRKSIPFWNESEVKKND
ncbi:monovalent cation/H(+) antiporter subunit G [Natronospora cellulosivora (SeqCode)]